MAFEPIQTLGETPPAESGDRRQEVLRWERHREDLNVERLRQHVATDGDARTTQSWIQDRVALMRTLARGARGAGGPGGPRSLDGPPARDPRPATSSFSSQRPGGVEPPARLDDERSGPRAPRPRAEPDARAGAIRGRASRTTRTDPATRARLALDAAPRREDQRRHVAYQQARLERHLSWGAEVRIGDGVGAFVAVLDPAR